MVKSPFYDKNGLKRGAWSLEEDDKLRAYIQRYGHWNWRQLPKFAGLSRCGKSCRLRWMNYLRPEIKRGNYTKEEEEIIIKLQEQLGNKWSMIATKLPGRTDNEIKNHFHAHLKNRAKQNLSTSEVKEQPSETSQSESSQNSDSKAENVPPTDKILESFSLIPETILSFADFSSSNSHHDHTLLSERFQEYSGDFWTKPFIADNIFMENNCPLSLLDDGFISPYLSYDGVDLFHQVL